ncbi:MAG TPA: class I SAM-dependent methyltransferase [Alloacidobacterium sp.]|nr:class I SAM-dependent methyltransferase [Alloacidobacterium sp.]
MAIAPSSYDIVEYPGFAYGNTHPDQLAVMATLYGLDPAPVASCRVLEIACNEGANLIPMAYAIPGGTFTGFDLAAECVVRGQHRIEALGLKNIRLFQADLLEIGDDLGEFDYIIAHGLYAWVPGAVSDRLLSFCGKHLAEDGVAFISYNALPGSYQRQMIREMMLTGAQGVDDPDAKVRAGIEFLGAVAAARPEGDVFRALLQEQHKRLQDKRPHVLYHDDFSPAYHPVSFSQFVAHAARHGLQYLSESVLPPPNDPCFKPEFMKTVQGISSDLIAQEQMLDYARMRMYRETLLCRAHHKLQRRFPPQSFDRLCFASTALSEPAENDAARFYRLQGETKLHCIQPATIGVMERLIAAWPHTVPYGEVASLLAGYGLTERDKIAMLLLQMAVAHMIELHTWSPPLAQSIAEKPKAPATSRLDARTHDYTPTLWHTQVDLTDAVGRFCLQLLDGTRDRKALLEALEAQFPDKTHEELETNMEPNLRFLYRAGLLEA